MIESGTVPNAVTQCETSISTVDVRNGTTMVSAPYAYKVISGIPHYHEWNSENPNHYNWCGHASLKCVLAYHGISKTMGQLHTIFLNNSPGGYGAVGGRCGDNKFCASLYDLQMACQNNLGRPSSLNDPFTSISTFWQKLKGWLNSNKPVIVPSYYLVSYGHMYVVVGFEEGANDTERKVYLRDVRFTSPQSPSYDRVCDLSTFYTNRDGNQMFVVR